MGTAKQITLAGIFTALLIGAQWALSFVAGVEIVTVLLLAFCFCCGVKVGLMTATAFSLLRCFLFGFTPSSIVLYLIYYNAFALFFGWLGGRTKQNYGAGTHFLIVLSAVLFTAAFTLLDDVITPLVYGWNKNVWKAYFLGSLPVMATQCVCSAVSVGVLFYPLKKVLMSITAKNN